MATKKNLSFEEAMASLEDSVSRLESGSLTLDESLEEFENAVKLVKLCNQKLDSAKQKIEMLTVNADGEQVVKPFGEMQDEN